MYSKDVVQRARAITRHYGRGFYRASFLFDRKTRESTWLLYALVRIPDEMVDTEKDRYKGEAELKTWIDQWNDVFKGDSKKDSDPLLHEAKKLFDIYNISETYMQDFFKAMMSDFSFKGFETYEELEQYMYGSASVVGIMMSHIIGYRDGALPYAKALGEAFQLVNFIRDAGDDFRERERIYFPIDEMNRFGVDDSFFQSFKNEQKWKEFMKYQINRARSLLIEGEKGIHLLDKNGRRAVYASVLIYEALLKKIEKNNFDTITARTTLSTQHKSMLLLKALCKRNL